MTPDFEAWLMDEFIMDEFIKEYAGTKDKFERYFNNWLDHKENYDWIKLANQYAKEYAEGK